MKLSWYSNATVRITLNLQKFFVVLETAAKFDINNFVSRYVGFSNDVPQDRVVVRMLLL